MLQPSPHFLHSSLTIPSHLICGFFFYLIIKTGAPRGSVLVPLFSHFILHAEVTTIILITTHIEMKHKCKFSAQISVPVAFWMFSQCILCAHVCLVLSSNHHKPFSAVFSKGNLHSFFYIGQETKHNPWLLFSLFPLYPTLVTPTDSPNMSICLYLDISILAQASIISHLNY